METKLGEIIHKYEKEASNHNCEDCSCDKRACLESLLDVYNFQNDRK